MPSRTDGLVSPGCPWTLARSMLTADSAPAAEQLLGHSPCPPARTRVGYVLLQRYGGDGEASGESSGVFREAEVRRASWRTERSGDGSSMGPESRISPVSWGVRRLGVRRGEHPDAVAPAHPAGELQGQAGPQAGSTGSEVGQPATILAGIELAADAVERTRDGTRNGWWLPRAL